MSDRFDNVPSVQDHLMVSAKRITATETGRKVSLFAGTAMLIIGASGFVGSASYGAYQLIGRVNDGLHAIADRTVATGKMLAQEQALATAARLAPERAPWIGVIYIETDENGCEIDGACYKVRIQGELVLTDWPFLSPVQTAGGESIPK